MSSATDFRTLLRNRLVDAGWEIVTVNDDTEWWCDLNWSLESVRQAPGKMLHITFMTCPMDDAPNIAGVWQIVASRSPLKHRLSDDIWIAQVALQKGRLRSTIEAFVDEIGAYRDNKD